MNDSFEKRLRQDLRQSEQHVDADTRARLAAARQQALANAAPDKYKVFGWSPPIAGLQTAGTLAVIAVVIAVIVQTMNPIDGQNAAPKRQLTASTGPEPGADSSPVTSEVELYENLELLEFYEELEFYEWLADEMPEERTS